MFTIEVKKKGKDEEFSFKDLEMFHRECFGGEISVSPYTWDGMPIIVTCNRCKAQRIAWPSEDQRIAIIRMVVEGGEIRIGKDIVMVQTT